MAKQRSLTCGWCSSGNHPKCPGMMQAHRHTPNGKELREIHCACTCDCEAKQDRMRRLQARQLLGFEE